MNESFSKFCMEPLSEINRGRMRKFLTYCVFTSFSKYPKDDKAVTNNLTKVVEERYMKKGVHSVTLIAALLKVLGWVIEITEELKGEPIFIQDSEDDEVDTEMGPAGIRIRVKPTIDGKFTVKMNTGSNQVKTAEPVDVEKAQETVKEFIRIFADEMKRMPLTEAEVIEAIKESEKLN